MMCILGKLKSLVIKRPDQKFLTGLTVPQEYCCLELEQMAEPLKVILTTKGNAFTEGRDCILIFFLDISHLLLVSTGADA